jgi:hypothetical protein
MNTKCFDMNAKCINAKGTDFSIKATLDRHINTKATYRDLNHRINYCKLSFSGDIEVNPGPTFVNPDRSIHAPYSRGNVAVFGENVYRYGSILHSSDLVNIMNVGNKLYSMLSRLSGQNYLLLTDLPTLITVEDTNYSFEFSESYTGNLHVLHPFCHALKFCFRAITPRNI